MVEDPLWHYSVFNRPERRGTPVIDLFAYILLFRILLLLGAFGLLFLRRKEMGTSKKFWSKRTLISLGLGQFVSLLITSTSFSSSELSRRDINAPTSQSFVNYALLAVVYGAVTLWKRRGVKTKWYYYLLLAIVDVEANFFVVKAYQYTNITSIMLLDSWVIPCVLVFTLVFLKTRYRYRHYIGVVICVAGSIAVVFSDIHSGDKEGGSNRLKGDFFVIISSTLYAVSNVSEEFLVREGDRVELLAMLGFFGAIVSAIQISILERRELSSINWTVGATLPFVGYTVAMFLLYSTVPTILKIAGSAMFNLSLLTSDMWGVLIRTFAYHEKVDWIYFVAFFLVLVGLIFYSGGMKDQVHAAQNDERDVEAVVRNPMEPEFPPQEFISKDLRINNNSVIPAAS